MNPEPMRKLIARTVDMDRNSANEALSGFRFPLASEQKTDAWIGDSVSAYGVDIARFFVSRNQLEKPPDSFDSCVNTRFLP